MLDYKATDDILLYASASTGFRSGAFDMAQSDPDLVDKAVDPETVISYELGAKTRLFNDRVQLNIAVFDITIGITTKSDSGINLAVVLTL